MNQPAVVAFKCRSCGQAMKAKAEFAGRKTACPKCKQAVEIPNAGVRPPSATAPMNNQPSARKMPAIKAPGAAIPPGQSGGRANSPSRRPIVPGNVPPAPQAGVAMPQPMADPLFGSGPGGYPQPGYPQQAAFAEPAFSEPSFPNQPGHPPNYPQPGYPQQQGYPQPGYPQPGYPQPGQAAGTNPNETCPSCGSFYPLSQPNCTKCRFSRRTGKKAPYQSMTQPVAKLQAAPPRPRASRSSEEGMGLRVVFMGGGLLLTLAGFGVAALMVMAIADSSSETRVRGKAFILPFMMIAGGIGIMSRAFSGE